MTYEGTDRTGLGDPISPDPDIWTDEPAAPGPRRPPRSGDGPRPPRRSRAESPPAAPPRRPRRPEPDDEYFDLPHESRIPRWLVALAVVVLLVVGVVGGAMWWYHKQVEPSGGQGAPVQVVIPEGASTSKVASILDDHGVISSATVFGFYVGGKDLSSVQAGTYTFREHSSFDEAIAVLQAGPAKPAAASTTKVNIPEGYTIDQTVARINERVPRLSVEELDAALAQGKVPTALKPEGTTSYEGLLFPATYEVGDEDTAVRVLTAMAQEMETRTTAMDIKGAASAISESWGLELTPYDLINVASLVQEEAGSPEEAPKIAAVIYNRLREGMPLGIDATSRYLATIEGGAPDYQSQSPYNTRTQPGLPPTPIASPGEYALEGALHPAEGPWLYYVLTDPGVHSFTADYDEFLRFKDVCIQKDLGCG